MFTMVAESTRKTFSAAAAIAIVSFGGLAMDQAHLASAPRGSVEIGELSALGAGATLARLPEVVVVAKREPVAYYASAEMPEIVVVAKRIAHRVAQDGRDQRNVQPAIQAGF
jgi:hypothetical protein